MSDAWLAGYLVALTANAALVWLLFRWIATRILRRHEPRAIAIFGTPERRKNSMDQFFGLIAFLFRNQADLRDGRLLLACVFVKALVLLWFLTFVAMMFTPMFLKHGPK